MRPERFRRLRAVLDRRQPDLTVLMEKVNKPHNFSAILRNCDAVGALEAHVVLPDKGIDVHHHTSGGTGRWMRVRVHSSIEEAVAILRARGFHILAAHPADDSVDYREADYTAPTAFLMGAELFGVSERARELADGTVRIPMAGMAHSLNVSVATSLLLYEAFRQRQAAGAYDQRKVDGPEYGRLLFEWAYPRLARICRDEGVAYPPLGDDGQILGPLPRSVASRRRRSSSAAPVE